MIPHPSCLHSYHICRLYLQCQLLRAFYPPLHRKRLFPTKDPMQSVQLGKTSTSEMDKVSGQSTTQCASQLLIQHSSYRPVLVVYSNLYPLQMFTIQQSQIPDDPHVQEDYPAPEEVYRLAEIRDAVDVVRKVIPGASKRNDTSSESVLSVRLIDGRHTGGLRAVFL